MTPAGSFPAQPHGPNAAHRSDRRARCPDAARGLRRRAAPARPLPGVRAGAADARPGLRAGLPLLLAALHEELGPRAARAPPGGRGRARRRRGRGVVLGRRERRAPARPRRRARLRARAAAAPRRRALPRARRARRGRARLRVGGRARRGASAARRATRASRRSGSATSPASTGSQSSSRSPATSASTASTSAASSPSAAGSSTSSRPPAASRSASSCSATRSSRCAPSRRSRSARSIPSRRRVVYPAAERRADLVDAARSTTRWRRRGRPISCRPSIAGPTSSGSRTRYGASGRRRASSRSPRRCGRARPVPAGPAHSRSRRSGRRSPHAASPRPRTSSRRSSAPGTASSSRSRTAARQSARPALLRKVDAPRSRPATPLPADPAVRFAVSPARRGFVWRELGLVLLPDTQVFRKRPPRADRRLGRALASFADLRVGDHVVHEDHGVGKLLGFETKEVAGVTRDYLFLAFRGEDRLYVPHEQLGKLSKYIGADAGAPALSKLGGKAWQNLKTRARDSVRELAGELLQLYAQRQRAEGVGLRPLERLATSSSRRRSRTGRPTTSGARSRRSRRISSRRARWTASSAATSASARPRSRSAPRSRSRSTGRRCSCSARRRSSPSSTGTPSASATATSRSASRWSRASAGRQR